MGERRISHFFIFLFKLINSEQQTRRNRWAFYITSFIHNFEFKVRLTCIIIVEINGMDVVEGKRWFKTFKLGSGRDIVFFVKHLATVAYSPYGNTGTGPAVTQKL